MHTAQVIYDAAMMDLKPSMAAAIDFGLFNITPDQFSERYSAIQKMVRHNWVAVQDLKNACGDGPALTKLVRDKAGDDVIFTTFWDDMPEDE